MKNALKYAAVLSPLVLAACGGAGAMNQVALATSNSVADVVGPLATDNTTVYSDALVCLRGAMPKGMVLAVGSIPDKTGKYSIEQDGAFIAKSASEMAITAIHRSGALQVDRQTNDIPEFELKYAGKKVLGDGTKTTIKTRHKDTGAKGTRDVKYRVILPGDMRGSTHYITGSISELNFNTFSGGAELAIMGIGGGARTFMMTVAVDLKVVDTKSTVIVDNVTYKKRILGYETKAGVFKFFGGTLVDFNIGEKSQEPMHLALRSIIERSTYEVLAHTVDPKHKKACDVLLKEGDEKVTTVEAVSADKIAPVASTTNNESEYE